MKSKPYYIIGPCAAESREQVLQAAQAIAQVAQNLHGSTSESKSMSTTANTIFRAGVWKPRTSPESFQGAGDQALLWLQEVQSTYGLSVATEVATPEQTRKALQAGVRTLWIGARTSANPIAVQEIADTIADCLQAGHMTEAVFVKNPVNEDTALWAGNIRRLQAIDGIRVGAIHRGCGHRPCWRMVYTLRHLMPEIPILLDPSHLSGDTQRVAPLAHKGMDELRLDGLMVEVHPTPSKARSDAAQQITPTMWGELYRSLCDTCSIPMDEADELVWLRAIMDETDDRLWDIVRERMQVSKEIGDYKRAHHMPIIQSERWDSVMKRRKIWAENNGLSIDAIEQIMNAIHTESCRVQE